MATPDGDFSSLFNFLPIGAYRSAPDGRMIRANEALVRFNGHDSEASLIAGVGDIAAEWYVDPRRRDDFRRLLERDGFVRGFVSEVFRHKTRERAWVSENAHAVRDAAGQVLHYEGTVEDITDGDTAGIKGATIKIEGEYAFGHLRTETGVHRLVRKSPFDSSGGRHTSFASVFVYPEIDDSIEININPADVRTDTFRASGAGGQHINKTDSAVRLTHIPTGIVVQCQDGRSQHSNRDVAWQRLRSRLYDHELRKQQEEQQKLEDTKTDVGWGHQIRSYVLDNSRIKDLRTNVEISATQKVLDGDLDAFIEASLKQGV